MNSLLKVSSPRAGVCVSGRVESAVIASVLGAKTEATATDVMSLPISYGAMLPERESIVAAARRLFDILGRAPVALSLPDALVKTTVLGFDELPAAEDEAVGVIAWKASKGLFMKPSDVSVGYQVLSSAPGRVEVLSTVIRNEYAEFFEDAFLSAGLTVSCMSSHTFDLYNAVRRGLGSERNFVFLANWGADFSFTGFIDGTPCFHRFKEFDSDAVLRMELETSFTHYAIKCGGGHVDRIYCAGGDVCSVIPSVVSDSGVTVIETREFLPQGAVLPDGVSPLGALISMGALLY